MLYELANSRQSELLANARHIALQVELEQVRKLDRLQRTVTVVLARLGLTPAAAR